MAIINVSDKTFQTEVEHKRGIVLVDFWASYCGPCKKLAPILEKLEGEVQGQATITKVNVEKNPEAAARFSVMSIPTIIVFKNGKPVDRVVGVKSKNELKDLISKHQ